MAVGEQLGVESIVIGSFSRESNRAQVAVHLINAKADAHVWNDTFVRDVSDEFSLQAKVARTIRSRRQSAERQTRNRMEAAQRFRH